MGMATASDDALCTAKRDILTLLSERTGRPLSIAQLPDGVQGGWQQHTPAAESTICRRIRFWGCRPRQCLLRQERPDLFSNRSELTSHTYALHSIFLIRIRSSIWETAPRRPANQFRWAKLSHVWQGLK
jgi:hypothetical protein